MEIIEEVIIDDLKDYSDLEYYDPKTEYIDLFLKNNFLCYVKVWLDRENSEREYIIINNEIIYLNTLVNINAE